MHGHAAFYGAYAMIVLAMITYRAARHDARGAANAARSLGYWAFWLQVAGMFGMTLSFATAGIGQVYLERILGLGYLDTQLKIQVHFLMLIATGILFAVGRRRCSSSTSSATPLGSSSAAESAPSPRVTPTGAARAVKRMAADDAGPVLPAFRATRSRSSSSAMRASSP